MTKTFKLTPDLTCPELDGYKLPEMQGKPIAIEVEMVEVYLLSTDSCAKVPNTHPDGTLKGKYIYSLPDGQPE
jgi:hypothetical protein